MSTSSGGNYEIETLNDDDYYALDAALNMAEHNAQTQSSQTPSPVTQGEAGADVEVEVVDDAEFTAIETAIRDAETLYASQEEPQQIDTEQLLDSPARRTRSSTRKRAAPTTPPRQRKPPSVSHLPTPSPSPQKRQKRGLPRPTQVLDNSSQESDSSIPPTAPVRNLFHQSPSSSQESQTPRQGRRPSDTSPITINRAPVLCLWVAVVAVREGYPWKTALSFGKYVMT
ncbi:hypothetical protein HK104_005763, partial [Borealophlyctis nickersoniae]